MVERFARLQTGGSNRARLFRAFATVLVLMGSGVAIGCVLAPQIARQKTQECTLEESVRAVRELLAGNAEKAVVTSHLVNVKRHMREALSALRQVSTSSHPSATDASSLLASLREELR